MGFSGKMIKALAPFIGMFAVIALFHFTDFVLLKYYPPIVNFGFFAVFFSSLFQEKTVIQKIALAAEPDADENVMRYTRNLTYVWAGFTFLPPKKFGRCITDLFHIFLLEPFLL